MRADGRQRDDELRRLDLLPDWLEQAHGSVLYSQGKTRVLCTAMVEDGVPRWLYRSGRGWMTAEYSLLPASTGERVAREAATQAPEIAAQRVPPSAWSTSQSSQSVRSPSASKSQTDRSARPISRWISTVRPPCLPFAASRATRSPVEAGRSEYSAVIQPRPER